MNSNNTTAGDTMKTTKMQEGRRNALLDKEVRYMGVVITKRTWLECMHKEGAVLVLETFPKYIFNRTAFNRMGYAEQKAYDLKLQTKMPYSLEEQDGTYREITKTEADYFAGLKAAA